MMLDGSSTSTLLLSDERVHQRLALLCAATSVGQGSLTPGNLRSELVVCAWIEGVGVAAGARADVPPQSGVRSPGGVDVRDAAIRSDAMKSVSGLASNGLSRWGATRTDRTPARALEPAWWWRVTNVSHAHKWPQNSNGNERQYCFIRRFDYTLSAGHPAATSSYVL
jgi:hypothetical protein